jgi:hypothetical protein
MNRFFRKYRKLFFLLFVVFLIFQIFKSNKTVNQKNLDQFVKTQSYLELYNDRNKLLKEKQTHDPNLKVVVENGRLDQIDKEKYTIIQYTPIFGKEKLCNKYNELRSKMFLEECPYKNCEFTCEKNNLENSNTVLLFHEWDLSRDGNLLKKAIKLHEKYPSKLFVLYNDEADPIDPNFDKVNFNWTMSYRLDAEVSDCSYGCYYKKLTSDSLENQRIMLEKEFKKRKSEALWLVSNCLSRYRIDFANKLNDFVNLNVYGSCKYVRLMRKMFNFSFESFFGKMIYSIVRGLSRCFLTNCGRDSECEDHEFRKNMFYLSFESKNCSNYITEKFWRILGHGLIPGK